MRSRFNPEFRQTQRQPSHSESDVLWLRAPFVEDVGEADGLRTTQCLRSFEGESSAQASKRNPHGRWRCWWAIGMAGVTSKTICTMDNMGGRWCPALSYRQLVHTMMTYNPALWIMLH